MEPEYRLRDEQFWLAGMARRFAARCAQVPEAPKPWCGMTAPSSSS